MSGWVWNLHSLEKEGSEKTDRARRAKQATGLLTGSVGFRLTSVESSFFKARSRNFENFYQFTLTKIKVLIPRK